MSTTELSTAQEMTDEERLQGVLKQGEAADAYYEDSLREAREVLRRSREKRRLIGAKSRRSTVGASAS